MADKKWIQKAVKKMKKKGTVGSLTAKAKREGGYDKKNKRIKKSWLRSQNTPQSRFALNVNKKEEGGFLGEGAGNLGGIQSILGGVTDVAKGDTGKGVGSAIGAGVGMLSNLVVPGLGAALTPILSQVGGAIGGGVGKAKAESEALNRSIQQMNAGGVNPYYNKFGGVIKKYADGGKVDHYAGYRGTEGKKALQQQLKDLGFYEGKIDAILGKGTGEAVRKFQESKGLAQDSIAGAKTLAALRQAVGSGATNLPEVTVTAKKPVRKAEPTRHLTPKNANYSRDKLETMLQDLGYNTNKYGKDMSKAMDEFYEDFSGVYGLTNKGHTKQLENAVATLWVERNEDNTLEAPDVTLPKSPIARGNWEPEGGTFDTPPSNYYSGPTSIGGTSPAFASIAGIDPAKQLSVFNYAKKALDKVLKGRRTRKFVEESIKRANPKSKKGYEKVFDDLFKANGGVLGNHDAFMFKGLNHEQGGQLVSKDGLPFEGGEDEVEGGEYGVTMGKDTYVFSKRLKI